MILTASIDENYAIWKAVPTDKNSKNKRYLRFLNIHFVKGFAIASDGFIMAIVPASYSGDIEVDLPSECVRIAQGTEITIDTEQKTASCNPGKITYTWALPEQEFATWKRMIHMIPSKVLGTPVCYQAFSLNLISRLVQAIGAVDTGFSIVGTSSNKERPAIIPGANGALGIIMPVYIMGPHIEDINNLLGVLNAQWNTDS